jgi:hypothetical protein
VPEVWFSALHFGKAQGATDIAPVFDFVLMLPAPNERVSEQDAAAARGKTVALFRADHSQEKVIARVAAH